MRKRSRRITYCFILLVFCFGSLFACGKQNDVLSEKTNNQQISKTKNEDKSHNVSIMFVNVGYGDSAIVMVDDMAYLIDTGTKASVPTIYSALAYCNVKKLNGVFLTHKHSDHIGGFTRIAQKYPIDTFYSAEISMNEENGENLIDNLTEKVPVNHRKLKVGDTIEVVDGVSFEVIGPLVYNDEDDNDNSLVLRLNVNDRTFLFVGDMQFAEEATLLDAGVDLSADVLKVGNHGNKDATSKEFASAVSPDIAIISTDTSEDKNSANKRVKKLLKKSDLYITQDFDYGILLTLNEDNTFHISNPKIKDATANIDITSVSKENQTVTLKNNGEDIDISGYFISSTKGKEIFVFPEGSKISAGQSITIASTEGDGDYIWEDDSDVWNKEKEDIAQLYDNYGNIISTLASE